MDKNIVETLMGALVLVVAGIFIAIAYKSGNFNTGESGYPITAKFEGVDGITIGSDVRIAGIKIGTVTGQTLDVNDYMAQMTLNIDDEVKIPLDSSAAIVSEGLLGSKYVSITPGAEEEFLKSGEEVEITQSSVNLEALLGKFGFGSAEDN